MIRYVQVRGKSTIHQLDLWSKAISLLFFLPVSALLGNLVVVGLLCTVLIVLVWYSQVGFKLFWKSTKIYFLTIPTVIIILSIVTRAGSLETRILFGAELSLRFIVLIGFGILFAMVTKPIEIPKAFLRLKLAHRYGIALMVAYRMLPMLIDAAKRVMDAQKARGADFRLSIRTFFAWLHNLSALLIPLVYITLQVSVNLSDTLLSRGYSPSRKITVAPSKFDWRDWAMILFSTAVLLGALIVKAG